MTRQKTPDNTKLDSIVAEARKHSRDREATYRERALKLFPWICGRCGREFPGARLRELTVHHKDHNHDNNPPDGSNWENLCIYCHDHEHSKYMDYEAGGGGTQSDEKNVIHKPFARLADLVKTDKR